jgi:hypothetical protein
MCGLVTQYIQKSYNDIYYILVTFLLLPIEYMYTNVGLDVLKRQYIATRPRNYEKSEYLSVGLRFGFRLGFGLNMKLIFEYK